MSTQLINAAIRSRFNTLVTTAMSLPTQFENDGDFSAPETALWARLSILPATGNQHSIGDPGNNVFRDSGLMIVSLFYPFGKGDKPIYDMVDMIRPLFQSRTEDGVTYRTPVPQRIGRAGKWWQVNVTVPWQSDRAG